MVFCVMGFEVLPPTADWRVCQESPLGAEVVHVVMLVEPQLSLVVSPEWRSEGWAERVRSVVMVVPEPVLPPPPLPSEPEENPAPPEFSSFVSEGEQVKENGMLKFELLPWESWARTRSEWGLVLEKTRSKY